MNIIKKNFIKLNQGFTMIELLFVMAILSILTGFVLVNYPNAQKRARDTQRKNDLLQYQRLLESYANKTDGFYVFSGGVMLSPNLCNYLDDELGTIACEKDPDHGGDDCEAAICAYRYVSNGTCAVGTACATNYVLWAPLEKGSVENAYWIVCSSGASGESALSSTPSNGNCPI